jgi:hypothetical protein
MGRPANGSAFGTRFDFFSMNIVIDEKEEKIK